MLLLLLLLLLLLGTMAPAESAWTFLSNTLGDDMVLQRAPASAVVFGVSNSSNATVTTKFGDVTLTTTSGKGGIWRQKLPPTPASLVGVNFTFTSSVGETAQLTGVIFGDVFLCGYVRGDTMNQSMNLLRLR